MAEDIKGSVVMYTDWLPAIRKLPLEDAARLFIALMEYAQNGSCPDFRDNLALEVLYTQYATVITRDKAKYAETIERRRQAALDREQKKREEAEAGKKTTSDHSLHNSAQSATDCTTGTVNVNDNVNGNENVNDNVNVNGNVNVNVNDSYSISAREDAANDIFIPPSVQDVECYCVNKGYAIDAEGFVDFYASKGWMIGKNKMKDWHAAVRNWARNHRNDHVKTQSIMDEMKDW